jgi:hypothetical protein
MRGIDFNFHRRFRMVPNGPFGDIRASFPEWMIADGEDGRCRRSTHLWIEGVQVLAFICAEREAVKRLPAPQG